MKPCLAALLCLLTACSTCSVKPKLVTACEGYPSCYKDRVSGATLNLECKHP